MPSRSHPRQRVGGGGVSCKVDATNNVNIKISRITITRDKAVAVKLKNSTPPSYVDTTE